jgi:IclR family acetate operon transcriptional repressor
LVNTLADEGLLTKDVHGRYVLGRSTAILAQAYLRGKSVSETLLEAVREAAKRTEETAYLADWGEQDIRVLASVEGSQLVRVAEVASPYEHGHARANGKVLLAYAWPEIREAYLRRHPPVRLTDATITDLQQLEKEFERIRKRGYAYDHEEFAAGVCCVAAPLLQNGRIIAALGLSVPAERFKKRKADLTKALLEVTAGLEAARAAADDDTAA